MSNQSERCGTAMSGSGWDADAPTYRVRVLSDGKHSIRGGRELLATYDDDPALIEAYADKIKTKFPHLTVEAGVKPNDGSWAQQLPRKWLWRDTVR